MFGSFVGQSPPSPSAKTLPANAIRQRHRNRKGIEKEKIKPTAQVAHLALPHPQVYPSQNQKSHFFANARIENRLEKLTL